MSASELIAKATEGRLKLEELEEVVRRLQTNSCDPYDALLIIGRAGAIQYRDIVERYLHCEDNPALARLALMILCRYWNLTLEYRVVLQRFVEGVSWDKYNDVRLLAISIAGPHVSNHRDEALLEAMIAIFRDRAEEQILREAAYCSLAESAGKTPLELPSAARHFDLERDVDPQVVAYIDAAERGPIRSH